MVVFPSVRFQNLSEASLSEPECIIVHLFEAAAKQAVLFSQKDPGGPAGSSALLLHPAFKIKQNGSTWISMDQHGMILPRLH